MQRNKKKLIYYYYIHRKKYEWMEKFYHCQATIQRNREKLIYNYEIIRHCKARIHKETDSHEGDIRGDN